MKISSLAQDLMSAGFLPDLMAAMAAFLIAYEEYAHHYRDKQQVFKAAFKTAVFTLLFFLVLGLLLSVILPFCF